MLAWAVLRLVGASSPRSRRVALGVLAVTFYPALLAGVLGVVLALTGDEAASGALGVMIVVLALVAARACSTSEDFLFRGPTERYLPSPVHGRRGAPSDRKAS